MRRFKLAPKIYVLSKNVTVFHLKIIIYTTKKIVHTVYVHGYVNVMSKTRDREDRGLRVLDQFRICQIIGGRGEMTSLGWTALTSALIFFSSEFILASCKKTSLV